MPRFLLRLIPTCSEPLHLLFCRTITGAHSRCTIASLILYVLGTVALGQVQGAPKEQPAISLYAGLSLTGAVGTVYSIQYVTELSSGQSNQWRCLEFHRLASNPELWVDKSAPANQRRFYRSVPFDAPTNLVFIAPGNFRMGSAETESDRLGNEGPQTEVTISKGFWMGAYEVTQGEYEIVTGSNPSGFTGDPNLPVETVSWQDATNYCALLTARDRSLGRIPGGSAYRLPTEAMWEYACRASTSTRFYFGDDPGYTNLTNYAWYADNSGFMTHAVAQKFPNQWGLFDMAGNVWEWCSDYSSANLTGGIAVDPQGPSTGSSRVLRGGDWKSLGKICRSAFRFSAQPDLVIHYVGFRVVLEIESPQ